MLAPLPQSPTQHLPGSPGKLAVLEARAAAGESLWHPADAADPLGERATVPRREPWSGGPRSGERPPRPPRPAHRSPYGRGVYLAFGRFRAEVVAHGRRHHLGSYATAEEAAAAARRAREEQGLAG